MENLASLSLFFAVGFIFALSVAWLFVKVAQRVNQQQVPRPGAVLRIRASSGMYRSHMVGLSDSVWTISAPIQRDTYVPLRVGEELVIEAACNSGALIFRSQIVAREADSHTLLIQKPSKVHAVERRGHRRWPHLCGAEVKLEGQTSRLIDLSEGGAKVKTGYQTHKGDRVRMNLPDGQEVYGWVISRDGDEARLRFEELLQIGPIKKETVPAS